MKWPPTDLALLEEIYKRYYPTYLRFSREEPTRSAKVYVPIDIKALATHFSVDNDIIFGRLYYYLEKKYGFKEPDGSVVHFFALRVGKDTNAIQFPLLGSVVATLRDERKKHQLATWLSIVALVISVLTAGISLFDE